MNLHSGEDSRYPDLHKCGERMAGMRVRGTSVDYDALLTPSSSFHYDDAVEHLFRILPPLWQKAYRKMAQSPTSIHCFSQSGFEFLFDRASELHSRGVVPDKRAVEDRIIVAYGRSKPTNKRNGTRSNRSLLGSAAARFGDNTRRPYLPGGLLGGSFDISLYPQYRDLDRERSNEGREYRDMKNYCCENLGTFCFTRLIYASRSWKPATIEHGLLRADGSFWIHAFKNEILEARRSVLIRTPIFGRKSARESSLAD